MKLKHDELHSKIAFNCNCNLRPYTLDEVGGEHNAERLWPVPGDGFKTLQERARVQDAEVASQKDYLQAVQAKVGRCRLTLV